MATYKSTPREQEELQRLLEWMKENEHTNASLARATGDFYNNVSRMTAGKTRISAGFKFRFGEAFGDDARNKLFRFAPLA
jgi:plasmid maintenance system antidote protein VapI